MHVETLNERRERQARQLASRKVTVTPRECSCISCERGPRRPAYMLVNGNVFTTPLTLKSMPVLLRNLRAS